MNVKCDARFYLALTVASLLQLPAAYAATTLTAADCSEPAVEAKVAAAQDGDTVIVPPGSCGWSNPLYINKNITLQGAGIGQTTLIDNTSDSGCHPGLIRWTLDPVGNSPAGFARLTGFTFNGGSNPKGGDNFMCGMLNFNGSTQNLRVDHNRLIASRYTGAFFWDNLRGSVDNNIVDLTGNLVGFDPSHNSWQLIGKYGDNSWTQPSTMGSADVLYFETNTCNGNIAGGTSFAELLDDHGGGARFAARFNILNDCQVSNHGTDSGGRLRGSRHWEYYNNTGHFGIYTSYYYGMTSTRGGTGMVFNNTASGPLNSIFVPNVQRSTTHRSSYWPFAMCGIRPVSLSASGGTATATFSESWGPGGSPSTYLEITGASNSAYNGVKQGSWISDSQFQFSVSGSPGSATGSAHSPWDGSTDTTGSPCLDQLGRGRADDFASADVPTPAWPHQALEPVYTWSNTNNGNLQGTNTSYLGGAAQPGRDFFDGTGSASVTGGVGVGTLGQRPGSCNTNEGYWATDQGNWNQSGSGGQGVLYRCTSPNTWTQYYTPYVYPHPLVSGAPVINNAQISCNGAGSCSIPSGTSAAIAWQGNTGATGCSVTLNSTTVGTGTSGSISPTLTQSSTYNLSCSGGSGTRTSSVVVTVTAPKFVIGDLIAAGSGGVLVRSTPGMGTSGSGDNILGTHAEGDQGSVIGGPQVVDGYTWWQVNFMSGFDGWATEPNLDKSVAVQTSNVQAVQLSSNGRFLVNADGSPFFWLGDTAWLLFHRLSNAEVDLYLQDRANKGYTVIQAMALSFLGYNQPNLNGDRPFTNGNISTPNEAYWAHVDYVVNKAESLGMHISIAPTWGCMVSGFNCFDTNDMLVVNSSNAGAYGQFLGNRYRGNKVFWMLGGDTYPNGKESVYASIANGIASGCCGGNQSQALIYYHTTVDDGGRTSKYFQTTAWDDFNTIQSGHYNVNTNYGFAENYTMIEADYALSPAKPTIDAENSYEDTPDGIWNNGSMVRMGEDVIRRKAYMSVFSGAFGHTYGHNDVFMFYVPGQTSPVSAQRTDWHTSLNSAASTQLGYLKSLILSHTFLNRVPDQSVIASAVGSGTSHKTATRASDGSYAMVYIPQGDLTTINMSKITGSGVNASWFNPRTGAITTAGSFSNTGTHDFAPPTSGNANDWVLILEPGAAPVNKFVIGDRVIVVPAGALARSSPGFGTNGSGDNLLGSHVGGELGTVIGGPQSADGYIWWNVNYATGADGWTTEQNIDLYTGTVSACDVNADGSTNVSDVQSVVNQALTIAPCTADINHDQLCNVIDVQRVVNAVLGGPCVSP